jgi:copper chaperone CopZ
MITRSALHIDCNPIIPECGFKCGKCVQEIQSVLGEIEGVAKSYIEDEEKEAKLIVEHDPSKVTVEQLMDTLKRLPSFYKSFFVPELIEA